MLTRCPVCDDRVITVFDKIDCQQRGVASIYICRSCLALLNGAAYDALEKTSIADLQKTEFYSVAKEESATSHLEKIDIYKVILNSFFKHEPRSLADLNFLDFGCGRGYAAFAASTHCNCATAFDYDLAAFDRVAASLRDADACPTNMAAIEDLDRSTLRYDFVFMWHVLEHLPYPSRLWRENRKHLQPNASFAIQSPMLRPEYVIDAHFIFFTESSLHRWAHEIGAEAIAYSYDVPRGFVTLYARMTDDATAIRAMYYDDQGRAVVDLIFDTLI